MIDSTAAEDACLEDFLFSLAERNVATIAIFAILNSPAPPKDRLNFAGRCTAYALIA